MTTELTDEQLGRAWCEKNGRKPMFDADGGTRPWVWLYTGSSEHALPMIVYRELDIYCYSSEEVAYAELGASIRDLHRRALQIRAVLEGVL